MQNTEEVLTGKKGILFARYFHSPLSDAKFIHGGQPKTPRKAYSFLTNL
jgi:hypothetical protein